MVPHPTSPGSSPMRTCPVCSRQYEPPAQFCQVDGVALRIDAPAIDPYLGTKILEQFRLDRVIGAGGMGVVYEGWNDALSRRVAVKILHRDPGARGRGGGRRSASQAHRPGR